MGFVEAAEVKPLCAISSLRDCVTGITKNFSAPFANTFIVVDDQDTSTHAGDDPTSV